MPDDPRPRLSLRNLPPSTMADEPDMPPLDHTTPAAAPLVEQLFPGDTDNEVHLLFGLAEKRVATRWRTGYSRLPLAASKKLLDQLAAKKQLVADIEAAIARAEEAGIHVRVTRYTLRQLAKSKALDRDEDPL